MQSEVRLKQRFAIWGYVTTHHSILSQQQQIVLTLSSSTPALHYTHTHTHTHISYTLLF